MMASLQVMAQSGHIGFQERKGAGWQKEMHKEHGPAGAQECGYFPIEGGEAL